MAKKKKKSKYTTVPILPIIKRLKNLAMDTIGQKSNPCLLHHEVPYPNFGANVTNQRSELESLSLVYVQNELFSLFSP